MTETTTPLPPAVQTVIATLRTVACWLPDDDRAYLLEAAHAAEVNWDGGCCPVCQETFCDGGCPLEDVRAGLYDGLMGDYEDPFRGPRGNLLATVDANMPKPKVPAEVIEALALGARRLLEIELAMASAPSPFRDRAPEPQPSPGCYAASWGMVHSRPSCRCSR